MRGKRSRSVSGLFRCRIIPAHAGQTPAMPHRAGSSPDHPRACGANMVTLFAETTVIGSSPRMRGKPHAHEHAAGLHRIIPAHAGQTAPSNPNTGSLSDHPRACGANPDSSWTRRSPSGSSPRMRGKRRQHRDVGRAHRIIPAHAGQTWLASSRCGRPTDHPRACGANPGMGSQTSRRCGSSPRMRGKLGNHGAVDGRIRIIPAHAGQTATSTCTSTRRTDHPRACGANKTETTSIPEIDGSSPRMRGKPGESQTTSKTRRIIPAHAGQTPCSCAAISRLPDHPRACGANQLTAGVSTLTYGSSPRMRGKRNGRGRISCRMRIIPAHAGQTLIRCMKPTWNTDHPRACGAN